VSPLANGADMLLHVNSAMTSIYGAMSDNWEIVGFIALVVTTGAARAIWDAFYDTERVP
jgi:hypothetical protein